MIDLYASIELRDGRSRRPCTTQHGSTSDPVEIARYFSEIGVAGLHLVDIDARAKRPSRSRVVIAAIAAETGIPVQVDSGATTRATTESMLDTQAERIVLDRAAMQEPGLVEWLGLKYPERVLVSLGVPDPSVVSDAKSLGDAGVALVTVDYAGSEHWGDLRAVVDATTAGVLVLVGDDAAADVEDLAGLEVGGSRHLDGVIVGGPLYAGPGRVLAALEICN